MARRRGDTGMSWNVVLQLLSQTHRRCDRFTIAGLPRPSRILIVPCDPSAVQVAIACHKQLQTEFASKAKSHDFCPGPIHPGCMTWDEAACAHVLVPVISQAPVSQLWLQEF